MEVSFESVCVSVCVCVKAKRLKGSGEEGGVVGNGNGLWNGIYKEIFAYYGQVLQVFFFMPAIIIFIFLVQMIFIFYYLNN